MIYYYGMKKKNLSLHNAANGAIGYWSLNKIETNYYGIIYYDRPLSSEKIQKYELTPLNNREAEHLKWQVKEREMVYER